MRKQYTTGLLRGAHFGSSPSQPVPAVVQGRFEVNVIFTNPNATGKALKYAMSLARELEVTVHLRAGIVVPWQLPLDKPPVSLAFTEQILSGLVSQVEGEGGALAADLYLCRDWPKTLLEILEPSSPVVIGNTKRWWPGPERHLAKALRSKGYDVIVADDREDHSELTNIGTQDRR